MSHYLGIDLGTQSLKVLVYDSERRSTIASASRALDLDSRADGTREQQAQWWLAALRGALGELDTGLKSSVAAVGVSGQQHGFVPLAADGTVLAPVKLWCDTATTAECAEITAAFGGETRCIEAVGNPIMPGYTAPKIRWLKKHRPEAYAALDCVLLPHDYLNYYLTGARVAECGDASGTALLDVRSRQWHAGMLRAVDPERDLARCLPPLIGANQAAGQLRGAVAEELGLPRGIPVACGGGDNMMAALGTGTVLPGRMTLSLGTSGTLFAYADAPCVDPQAELAAFCSSTGGWLPLLCTMNCTVATEIARSLFDTPLDELEALIARTEPGAAGVTVLPFYNGERTPNLPRGRGCIVGLDPGNASPANISRASMEAAVFGLRAGLEAFRRVDCEISDIRLTGGGARSGAWRQMIADCFGLPVRLPKLDEGAALGAAFNAMLLHNGAAADSQSIARLLDQHVAFDDSRAAQPDPARGADYQQAYRRYSQYVDALQPLFR